jgi:lipopolysaccharide/colanic/teichoic acid biosynthesis glycosyltransferase
MQNKEDLDINEKANNSGRLLYNIIKRFLDIIGGLVGLILFSPLMLGVAIAVKLDSKGPIVFSHKRLGQGGQLINIFKFRTMVHNAEEVLKNLPPDQKREFEKNFKLDKDPRITRIGGFLRRSSLDEFPQFFNVFIWNMTIVGPRPIVPNELNKYGSYADKLLSVKPGLTGNWQTSGRSETTYEERIQLDMDYIDNRNTWTDIKIILKTVIVVFKQVGAK